LPDFVEAGETRAKRAPANGVSRLKTYVVQDYDVVIPVQVSNRAD
jgi:hypothetical protein